MLKMVSVPSIHVGKTISFDDEEAEVVNSKVKKMKPHVPGIVTFADHNRPLPWTVTYHAIVMFADISGFTSLCERYSGMGQSGVDQLTRTLNEYLSALVEGILGSDGDILKFAGDAILAIWRVGRVEELQAELAKVVACCLDIQDKCGEWKTDIGVKLTVKIGMKAATGPAVSHTTRSGPEYSGISAGEMSITYIGNQEYRHYVELGPAVTAVNTAESFCKSGDVVMSPEAWAIAGKKRYEVEQLLDEKHVKVILIIPAARVRSCSLPTPSALEDVVRERKLSLTPSPSPQDITQLETIPSAICEVGSAHSDPQTAKPKQMKGLVSAKMKIGPKLGKLRKVVETVTEMRLDLALRLYILLPVLKKLDDDQPLEYLSEMRQVSIVFMNLVLSEGHDTAQLLQNTFELVYTSTKSMHGCLNKVFLFDKVIDFFGKVSSFQSKLGCTFLVIFGLPGYKHEQDCAHALLVSGRLMTKLSNMLGIKRVSIGVTTGVTFCGVVGHPQRHEYSVIGRKVNMAARLMMHYPQKVTCDAETYQKCRLPPAHFEVLVTQTMKGLQNVGVIREFIEQTKEETLQAKSIKHSDYPILGRHVEEFTVREQLTKMKRSEQRKHLIFSGAAGIGKTRLLDHLIGVADAQEFSVISCCVELHDRSIPYFTAHHIMRTLLDNYCLSVDVDQEQFIMEQLSDDIVPYLYLVSGVVGFNFEMPAYLKEQTFDEKAKRRELLKILTEMFLMKGSETVIIIDDAHNIDNASWEYMCELIQVTKVLIVLGLRPSIIEKPTCKEIFKFTEDPKVKTIDLGSLDVKYMAPLACQMMDVVSLPKDLDKILRERSHGVPSWCLEILKDVLDQNQLIVVLDDGRRDFRQSAVIPNKVLIKPVASGPSLKPPSDTILKISVTSLESVDPETDDERAVLERLGFVHEVAPQSFIDRTKAAYLAAPTGTKGLHVPTGIETQKTKEKEAPKLDKIAIFAEGVSAKDIPVPRSMTELIIAKLDSMRASDQLLVKCAAVLGMQIRKDILEMLLPKAHRPKMSRTIRRLMESGIFVCGNAPTSHIAMMLAGRDDSGSSKYRCYCPKDDFIIQAGELQVCSSPKFMNSLLQETAYECLLETQRIELHTKAARYFELSADEFREYIPYYVLARPPPDYLQEALEKSEAFESFVPHKKMKVNKITDEVFTQSAEKTKARRGRRQAVSVASEEAVPLVHRIVEKAKPLEAIEQYVEELLPIYDRLSYHWKRAGKTWNVLSTLLEETAAAIAVKRNAKGFELLRQANTLFEEQGNEIENEDERIVFEAKIHRLTGKILFQAGQVSEAYQYLSKAGILLKLKQPSTQMKTQIFTAKLMANFFLYWKFGVKRRRPTSFLALEQGYCLTDLFVMDRELGDTKLKFIHALQQFINIAGRTTHLHQTIIAYSCMIECSRERRWFDVANRLEAELLKRCAARHEELSTGDRSLLGGIYGRSCIAFFLKGDLRAAERAGRAAVEICICIKDLETAKVFTPYYFFVCLMRKAYSNSVDIMRQFRFASRMTDDTIAQTVYHALCLEAALAGGCPMETPADCLICMAKYLRTCDAAANEISTRSYIAMTAALWCARKEQWAETQTWFDYWELYETNETSFYSLLARANKIECMLHSLSKSMEIKNTVVAKRLRKHIKKDLMWCGKVLDKTPVLRPRFYHLCAYFSVLNGRRPSALRNIDKSLKFTREYENYHEEHWVKHNRKRWSRKPPDAMYNRLWTAGVDSCFTDWKLRSCLKGDFNTYTLPLPCTE